MDILVQAHSGVRWLVLLALLFAIVTAVRNLKAEWTEQSIRPFSIAAVLFDIQVTLGIITYVVGKTWESDDSFISRIHPLVMIIALGVLHMSIARARKSATTASYRTLLIGTVASLALVLAAIPW
jgi:hypothetical protein